MRQTLSAQKAVDFFIKVCYTKEKEGDTVLYIIYGLTLSVGKVSRAYFEEIGLSFLREIKEAYGNHVAIIYACIEDKTLEALTNALKRQYAHIVKKYKEMEKELVPLPFQSDLTADPVIRI